jgi:hypothetical protein
MLAPMTSLSRIAALALVAALGATPALATKRATDPETDKALGPGAGAGHYFGGQSSTSEFHGCRKSDEQWFPTSLLSGQQTTTPSSHRYVTFTVNTDSTPTFSWVAKDGYRICGVEVFAALANANTKGGELLAWASYKSDADKGSTAADGKETIMVHTPKNLGTDDPDLKIYAGQTLGMYGFQAVAVYVKKG